MLLVAGNWSIGYVSTGIVQRSHASIADVLNERGFIQQPQNEVCVIIT